MTPEIALRLDRLSLHLPRLAPPRFAYVPAVRSGAQVFFSGRTSIVDGRSFTGRLGAELDVDKGRLAARTAIEGMLAAVEQEVGLENVTQIIKLTGFVACVPGFSEQPTVIDAASLVLVDAFGPAGRHARSAVGVSALPGGAAVELELTLEASP